MIVTNKPQRQIKYLKKIVNLEQKTILSNKEKRKYLSLVISCLKILLEQLFQGIIQLR